MSDPPAYQFKKHPVQLRAIKVRELHIMANIPPNISTDVEVLEGASQISLGYSEYDTASNTFSVSIKLEIGMDEAEDVKPFSMRIELLGDFVVDGSALQPEAIEHFSRLSAPTILLPYLREHAYSLSAKCGFRPIILSLTEVPVLEKQ